MTSKLEVYLYEKNIECYVFTLLNTIGVVSLFSGQLEPKLGDGFFLGKDETNSIKALLLEFKALYRKGFQKVYKEEVNKFINLLQYFELTQAYDIIPHVLICGKPIKIEQDKDFNLIDVDIKGCNYAKFIREGYNDKFNCEEFKGILNGKDIKEYEEDKWQDLKERLRMFIFENGIENPEKFKEYLGILLAVRKERVEDKQSSGSEGSKGKKLTLEDILNNIKVVFANNETLEVASLGEILHRYFDKSELGNFLQNVEQFRNILENLDQGWNYNPFPKRGGGMHP
jgi:hypothetical protein